MLAEYLNHQQHLTFSFMATAAATGPWFASIPAAAILQAAKHALQLLLQHYGGELKWEQLADCMHIACKLPHAAAASAASSRRGVQYRIVLTISEPDVADQLRRIVTHYGLGQLALRLLHAGHPVSSQPVVASMHEQETC